MNYSLNTRQQGNTGAPSLSAQLTQAFSKQPVTTNTQPPVDNFKRPHVGVTTIGVKAKSVKHKGAGNPNRSFAVNVIHKALARMGGR